MSVYKRTIVSKGGKKSLYWYVEVGLPNGKKIKRSIGKVGEMTKAVARQVEQDLKRKVKLGQWEMIQATIPTFNEFIPEFISYLKEIKQNRGWKGAKACVATFAKCFGSKKLSEITSANVEDFKRIRTKEGKKPATTNSDLAFVRHLFNYAERCNKFYGKNPVSISGLLPVNNQKTRVLTIEEEMNLLENCRDFLKPIVLMALHTGMRSGEIRTLKWENVDFNINTITIEMTNSKTKRTRIIPVNQVLRKVLLEQKLKTGSSAYVFGVERALKDKSNHDYYFKLACKQAKILGLRFHDLRHTAATRMIEAGASIVAVSKILGHSDIKMTMRYSHPDNSLREAVETLAKFRTFTPNITTSENLGDSN